VTTLSRLLMHEVPSAIRARGDRYFYQGRVQIQECTRDRVIATVVGTRPYDVEMVRREQSIRGCCTCPYFCDHLDICKHLWATLQAGEEVGFGGPAGSRSLRFDADPDPPSSVPEHEDPLGGDGPLDAPGADGPRREGPDWAKRLEHVRDAALESIRADASAGRIRIERLDRGPVAAPDAAEPIEQRAYLLDVVETNRTEGQKLVLRAFHRKRHQDPRTRRLDGEWGAWKPLGAEGLHRAVWSPTSGAGAAEREAAGLLRVADAASSRLSEYHWDFYGRDRNVRWIRAPEDLAGTLLPLLVKTGALRLLPDPDDPVDPVACAPLAHLDPRVWRPRIRIEKASGDGSVLRTVFVPPPGKTGTSEAADATPAPPPGEIDLHDIAAVIGGSWMVAEGIVARIDFGPPALQSWTVLEANLGPTRVEAAEMPAVVEQLAAMPGGLDVEWPPEYRLETREVEPEPLVRITPAQGDPRKHPKLRVTASFDYGGIAVEASDAREAVIDVPERLRYPRAVEREARFLEELVELGAEVPANTLISRGVFLPADRELRKRHLTAFVNRLLARDVRVEAEGRLFRAAGTPRLRVRSRKDWFDLEGGVDYDGRVIPIPEILRAAREGRGWVELGDGTYGVLPKEWLERHGWLLPLGEAGNESIRFSSNQAVLLDAMLAARESEASAGPDGSGSSTGGADLARIGTDARFERVRRSLRRASRPVPQEEPRSFRGTLRPYQREGLSWMRFLAELGLGGCLADDMGLGKTVQVLALLARHHERRGRRTPRPPSIVVVPRSLVFNWRAEAERFTPRLRVVVHSGPDRARATDEMDDADVILVTYGTLRRDIDWLSEAPLSYAILDEAQAVKNASSQSARAVRLLRAEHRFVLTGTPVENHLGELASLMEFLNPGLFGKKALGGRSGSKSLLPDDVKQVGAALGPMLLRRTKAMVAADLPEKNEQTIFCDLDAEHRETYDHIRAHYRSSLLAKVRERGLGRAKIQVLEALLRLRQAACHPRLIAGKSLPGRQRARRGGGRTGARSATDEPGAKLRLLLEHLEELRAEGHKALVFSQFTRFLAVVREALDEQGVPYEYLDGRTRDRGAKVERFQSDPDCPFFLISLKAGGHGLNLTAAEYVFLLDPWWNPAVEAQAIDRAHRIGQTRKVFAYRIIARDTVEEKVLDLQEEKRELADAILSGARESVLREMSVDDLERLLG